MFSFLTTCVYPENLSNKELNNAQNSLNSQLLILLLSCLRYYPESTFYIFTNKREYLLSYISTFNKLNSLNIRVIPEDNECELKHCKKHSGEHFTYAFCKLDAIHYYKKSKYYTKNKNIILSDLDSILLPKEKKHLKFYMDKSPIALSYKCEIEYGYNLHKVINLINRNTPLEKIKNKLTDHWINSGFIILNNHMINSIESFSEELVENLRSKREYVKSVLDHYSDEIVFCSFFKYSSGKGIPNISNNGIANFYWTTTTKTRTLRFISFFQYPFHLHLPTTKVQKNFSNLLTKLLSSKISFSKRIEAYLLISIINFFGVYGRYIRPKLSFIVKKFLFLK